MLCLLQNATRAVRRLPPVRVVLLLSFSVSIGTASWLLSLAESPQANPQPQTTENRLLRSEWWPTKGNAPRKDYAGAEACALCHAEIYSAQQQTSMAHAALRPPLASLAQPGAHLTFQSGGFTSTITPGRKGDTYSVTRGGEGITAPIMWSFGEGVIGQTFILERNGSYFESQLSYYPAIHGLDTTPGHSVKAPQDLESALGELQSPVVVTRCFNCHATAATVHGQLEPEHMIPGVSCEACHGPGARHVAAMKRNDKDQGLAAIFNPATLKPVDQVDFCGACHRAPMDVVKEKLLVPLDIRFQPYRLSKSRCWSQPDKRLTCVACHDPHQPLVHDAASYDARCLACHRTKDETQPRTNADVAACPVSTSHCTGCHMPRYQVPRMHGSFTDHYIRIIRPGDPFPL
jgi:hypothetical protein